MATLPIDVYGDMSAEINEDTIIFSHFEESDTVFFDTSSLHTQNYSQYGHVSNTTDSTVVLYRALINNINQLYRTDEVQETLDDFRIRLS